MTDEQCSSAEPITWKVKARRAFYGTKHWAGMKWHALYWRTLHALGLGWAYGRLMCKLNLYPKYALNGRCQWCGEVHGKL